MLERGINNEISENCNFNRGYDDVVDYIHYVESIAEIKDIGIVENEMDNKVLNIHFKEWEEE